MIEFKRSFTGVDSVRYARQCVAAAEILDVKIVSVVAGGTWVADGMLMHPASAEVTIARQGVRREGGRLLLRTVGGSAIAMTFRTEGYDCAQNYEDQRALEHADIAKTIGPIDVRGVPEMGS